MRENRLSGSMKGRREETKGTGNCGQFNPLCPRPPTLLGAGSASGGIPSHYLWEMTSPPGEKIESLLRAAAGRGDTAALRFFPLRMRNEIFSKFHSLCNGWRGVFPAARALSPPGKS